MPPAQRLAFVCPRFADGATVGGAETLLKALADRAAAAGHAVTFLTTCAQNHFTWANAVPPGARRIGALDVLFFPVDERRDLEAFLRIQDAISRRARVRPEDEQVWLRNSVNSAALTDYLRARAADFDWIMAGPYLFGLTVFAARAAPERTLLVPCLHDEGFAYTRAIRDLFRGVAGILFNTEPEAELARRLYGLDPARCAVVGMGLDPFEADPGAFARRRGLAMPYVLYAGRREAGKGTPLLLDYVTLFRRRTGLDVKLVLAGSGEVHPPPELRPHVLDAGFLPEPEKREALAGAAALCHPSVNESLGIVVLEAWLARTPVLVHARCAVHRDQCRRSGGGLWFLIYPEFEEALLALLHRPALRRALGAAGRAYVEREYAWTAIDRKLADALARFGARRGGLEAGRQEAPPG